jgi:ribosomal protein L32E
MQTGSIKTLEKRLWRNWLTQCGTNTKIRGSTPSGYSHFFLQVVDLYSITHYSDEISRLRNGKMPAVYW